MYTLRLFYIRQTPLFPRKVKTWFFMTLAFTGFKNLKMGIENKDDEWEVEIDLKNDRYF